MSSVKYSFSLLVLCSLVSGEAAVKKVSKAVDSAVGNIGAIIVDHLQPTLQAAAFKLNELHSLAKCKRHFEPLGLQVRFKTFVSLRCQLCQQTADHQQIGDDCACSAMSQNLP